LHSTFTSCAVSQTRTARWSHGFAPLGVAIGLAIVGTVVRPVGLNNIIALAMATVLLATTWKRFRKFGFPRWITCLRPWLRFGVLALVATASIAAIFWSWADWSLRQVAARNEFIVEAEHRFDAPGAAWLEGQIVSDPNLRNIPLLIWLWVHRNGSHFTLSLPMDGPRDETSRANNWKLIQRAKWLFPEATISLKWREMTNTRTIVIPRPD
jgi:hypothetical protein